MLSAPAYSSRCATCNDGEVGHNHTTHPTPVQLQANIPRCFLCTAIWQGIELSSGGKDILADPRPIHLRLGRWEHEMFRVRYGRSTTSWHLDPSFTLIRKEGLDADIHLELMVIPQIPVIPRKPLASPTLSAVIKQIQNCKLHHRHSRVRKTYVPDRLVDLGPNSNQLDATLLCDTSGIKGPYLALSHCWGGTIPYRTLQSNKEDLCRRIDYSELSKNFQDAFTVARRLSYRYIWIDSFCIVQDDRQDWLQQAAKMADVYSGADLTISAARSSSFDEGFLSSRKTDIKLALSRCLPRGLELYVRDGEALERGHQGINRQPSDHVPLFPRAWAFQERLLSQRVLHFLKTEIVFECEESLWCECGEKDSYEDSKYDKEVYRSSTWEELVEQYMSRSLTYPTDILPAISAIARDYDVKGGYIAGLTQDELFSNLLWQVKAPRDLNGELITAPPPRRPSVYVAPTFSWASISAPVEWAKAIASYKDVCCLEDFAVTLENPTDPFGRVLNGHITLRGPVIEVMLRYSLGADEPVPPSSLECTHSSALGLFQGQLKGCFHPIGNPDRPKRDVWAVLDTLDIPPLGTELKLITLREETSWFFRNNGLVLKLSTTTQGYERIGCYWEADQSFFKDATTQSVTIV